MHHTLNMRAEFKVKIPPKSILPGSRSKKFIRMLIYNLILHMNVHIHVDYEGMCIK